MGCTVALRMQRPPHPPNEMSHLQSVEGCHGPGSELKNLAWINLLGSVTSLLFLATVYGFCRILVPRPGTEPGPTIVKAPSPTHIDSSPVSASYLERRDPFPACSGKRVHVHLLQCTQTTVEVRQLNRNRIVRRGIPSTWGQKTTVLVCSLCRGCLQFSPQLNICHLVISFNHYCDIKNLIRAS